jgi:PleD family two-component response regulator
LIVDDEPDIAQLISNQFTDEGYLTTVLGSGTEVLRIVREQQFDLILLDLLLPDIDGFTVLGGLRVQPETQLTPIILLSAINSLADKVRGLQLGADDYITKPFSDVELNARVQAAMRRSEREGGANPSTRLPGNIAIERAISQRIAQNDSEFAVCYCDIDNFKAYNDTYGFLKGDAVIQRTAQILLDTVREYGNPDDFVGHIGGDDFVVITSLRRLDIVCNKIISGFDATAPLLYDREARTRGYISGVDRQGRPMAFPLVSISIIAVSSRLRPLSHPGEVAQRSVEPKKRAKLISGSVLIIDE